MIECCGDDMPTMWVDGFLHDSHGHTPGLILDRIVSLSVESDGRIRIGEECDGWFATVVSKERAISMMKKAIEWIEGAEYEQR